MQSLELLGPLLQVERNILGASPYMQERILSVATRCATEPYSAAPPRRGTGPPPSSDAEASTDRAPRPAVWASTALSSVRVVVRGADVTGGKRGAAGRAGASGETHGRSSRCLYSTLGMRGRNDNDSGGATSPIPFTA